MSTLTDHGGYTDFGIPRANEVVLRPGTTDPDELGGITYVTGTGFRAYGASGVFTIPTSSGGGGGAVGDLDSVYDNSGNTITMDKGAITLNDSTTGALNMLVLNKTGAGSGNMLDVAVTAALTGNVIDIDMDAGVAAKAIYIDNGAGARTGSDIDVKDDSTGTHSVFNIEKSGSGASTGFDYQESYNGSSASFGIKITLDASDGIDTTAMQVVRGSGLRTAPVIDINDASTGSSDLIDVDLTGIFTGDVFSFNTSAASTGNVITAVMDNAVAMTALRITGAGVRTQPFIELIGTQTGSADMIDLSADGAFTGDVLAIDMNSAVGANAIFLDAGAATRTAPMVLVTFDGDGTTTGGTLFDINVTNTGAAANPLYDIDVTGVYTGNILDITFGAAAATGDAISVDLGATATTAQAMVVSSGAMTRSTDLFSITDSGTPSGDIMAITVSGASTGHVWDVNVSAAHTGNVLDITYSAAATGDAISVVMANNVAGSAMAVTGAGSRTDDLFKVDDASTSNSHVWDVNMTGAGSGNVLDISYATAAHTGDAINIAMGTAVAGSAIVLNGTGSRTDDMIKIDDDSTGNSHIFDINMSGIYTGNIIDIAFATAAATGDAIKLAMGTNVAGQAILITSAATGVSGEGSAFDVTHTGDLVAGANLVDIISTGSPSSTSHTVSIQQTTGAGSAGAYALYVNATGTNVEALKVDAGNVVFDENLTVTGTTTLTGAVTATAGVQSAAVAVTATADGLTTGLIPAGTRYVTATSDDANKIVTLPAATVGNVITMYIGATGCEVRTPAGSNVTINNVDSDGTNEAAIPATTLCTFTCTSSTSWILEAVDELGAVITAIVPDAA